jgi:hypothetical protein
MGDNSGKMMLQDWNATEGSDEGYLQCQEDGEHPENTI